MSDSLWPHGLQPTRLPCPLLSPGICSCPLSRWCNPTTSSAAAPSSPFAFSLSQNQGLCLWIGSLHQVAKVLELQLWISPSNEYSRLISFRIDQFDLLAVPGTHKSSLGQSSNDDPLQWWSQLLSRRKRIGRKERKDKIHQTQEASSFHSVPSAPSSDKLNTTVRKHQFLGSQPSLFLLYIKYT